VFEQTDERYDTSTFHSDSFFSSSFISSSFFFASSYLLHLNDNSYTLLLVLVDFVHEINLCPD